MKKIILFISIIFLVGAGYGLYQFSKKTPSLEKAIPDYRITADALFNEFETNEKEALMKYEDKILQITGKVEMILHTDSISNVILKAENALMGGVNCSFNNLTDLPQNDEQITIKGKCQGYLSSVILNNCVIEK